MTLRNLLSAIQEQIASVFPKLRNDETARPHPDSYSDLKTKKERYAMQKRSFDLNSAGLEHFNKL